MCNLVKIADVPEREAEWLVSGYIPKGQISIMAGDGGTGKTSLWCELAAAVSSGRKTFFEIVPEDFAASRKPGKVLFFSSEDSISITLKARLRKAEANLDNILSVNPDDDTFQEIKFNSQRLKDIITTEKPDLVIFDPLQGFVPPDVSMSQRNEMRNCLAPLITLGEQYGTAFLIVLHTNKRIGAHGRNRIADSADIWDICRSALIVGKTQSSGVRYMSHEKSNYGEEQETVLFSISESGLKLEGYTEKKDSDFVKENDFAAEKAPQRKDAADFICNYLKNGKQPTKDLDEAAKAAGISSATLARSKTDLRNRGLLGSSAEGFGKDKIWYSYLLSK